MKQGALGQALEEAFFPRSDAFVKRADADDIGAEAVAQDHPADGDGILGVEQVLTLQDALPALEDKARAVGANAIIIDSYQPVKSGIISTGYSVQARAVRVERP